MCPCPGDSGAISTELGRLPRSSPCFATSWLSGSKISTTLLPFLLSGKLAFTQLSTVTEFMPPRITRYLLSCRKERSFLVISVSSPSDDSQHECALPNTSLPQYGNESLLWSMFMRKEMILQCPQVTIKSHRSVPNRFAWCSRLSICARFSNHGNPGPLDRPAVM
uniref:Uncharacterized protein n=1 Tax=Oryza rufipogon TaxID=4529 RepID=A0A0E0R6U9_ORYRU